MKKKVFIMEKNNKTNIIASVGYPTTRDQPVKYHACLSVLDGR